MKIKPFSLIPDTYDPDDLRQRQILDILLWLWAAAGSVLFIFTVFIWLSGVMTFEQIFGKLAVVGGVVILCLVLMVLNRHRNISYTAISLLFVLSMLAFVQVSDSPRELASGWSTIGFVIPVVAAAALLPSWAVLVILVVITVQIIANGMAVNSVPNGYAIGALLLEGIVYYITTTIARRAIQDARRELANKDAILQNIVDGVLVYGLDGKIISVNQALQAMIPLIDLELLLERAPLGGTIEHGAKIFSITTARVPDVGTVAVFRDETRRREIERAKDSMLSTASHELRTPLAAISGYVEMLQKYCGMETIDRAEVQEMLGRMRINSERLRVLVNDILDRAQIEGGAIRIKHVIFEPRRLARQIHILLTGLVDDRDDLEVSVDVDESVPEKLVGDPDRLYQILVNLAGNGIKFTDRGKVTLRMFVQGKRWIVEVADTGAGIPPERLPDIFEPFRRSSDVVTRRQQGAGLGLSIAKQLTNLMEGEIEVRSQVGVGTTFTLAFTLPEVSHV